MKRIEKIILIAIACVFSANFASAKKVTLPNGKVLIDPYVISKRPDGLEVGHKSGIMFIKFTNMSVKYQKKYGYNPQKAAAYEKRRAKQKQRMAKEKKAKEARKRKIEIQLDKNLLNASVEKLEIKIKETENRIAFLKKEIPRLQKTSDTLLNSSTKLAGQSVSGSNDHNRGSGLYYGWDGGYVLGNSGGDRQAENTKRRQVKRLGNDYSDTKRRISRYQKDLLTKENDLVKMRYRLKKDKSRQK
jgi:hypothetical protein